jgi:hypothetical protein
MLYFYFKGSIIASFIACTKYEDIDKILERGNINWDAVKEDVEYTFFNKIKRF